MWLFLVALLSVGPSQCVSAQANATVLVAACDHSRDCLSTDGEECMALYDFHDGSRDHLLNNNQTCPAAASCVCVQANDMASVYACDHGRDCPSTDGEKCVALYDFHDRSEYHMLNDNQACPAAATCVCAQVNDTVSAPTNGYDKGDGMYTRVQSDAANVEAMRTWMGLENFMSDSVQIVV